MTQANPRATHTLDHIGIVVCDLNASRSFYQQLLATLGYELVWEVTPEQSGGYHGCGFGPAGRPQFWISQQGQAGSLADGKPRTAHSGLHVAFGASSRTQVDQFYQTALALGASDNGAPGLRPHYHPDYYGAFVWDLDGNNIEAVCHLPEATATVS